MDVELPRDELLLLVNKHRAELKKALTSPEKQFTVAAMIFWTYCMQGADGKDATAEDVMTQAIRSVQEAAVRYGLQMRRSS